MTHVASAGAARRLVATAPGRMELLRESAVPPSPAPGQICIRIEETLISAGTELAKVRGLTAARPAEEWAQNPLALGYSASGTVIAAGSHDDPFPVGTRVSASAPHADFAVVRCAQAAPLPPNVSFEEGTFGTLGALAVHIVRLSGLELGDTCAIVGFGVVGQLIALVARIAGAKGIAVLEHRESRRELAESLGFQAASEREAYDVVFECAGSGTSLTDALALAARCGRVVIAGSMRSDVTLNVYRDVHAKSVTLIGAHGSSQHSVSRINRSSERENRALALAYVADGRLSVDRLVTHRLSAAQSLDAFAAIERREANAVVLRWNEPT